MPPTGAVPAAYAGLAHAFGELRSLRPSLELATEVSAVTAVPYHRTRRPLRGTSKQARTTSRPKAVGRVIAIKSAIVGSDPDRSHRGSCRDRQPAGGHRG